MPGKPRPRRRNAPKVFLETTIQIDRFWDTKERREAIRRNLLGKEVCTSSYVRMEFQRTFIKDVTYVRSVVLSDCEALMDGKVFLSELIRKLARRGGTHGVRSVVRSHLVVACILDQFPDSRVHKSELVEYLNHLVESYGEQFYEVDLTLEKGPILDVSCSNFTDCDLVKNHFPNDDRRRFHCRREEAMCQLPQFLQQHAETIEMVRQAFELSSDQNKPTMPTAAERILKKQPINWNAARGQKNCWPLGDTIIALESPIDAAIYTTDHHYEVICPIVGRDLFEVDNSLKS